MQVLSSVFDDNRPKVSPKVTRVKSEPVTFEFREPASSDTAATRATPVDNLCNSYMCGMESCRKDLRLKLMEKLETLLCEHQEAPAQDPWENYVFRLCLEIQNELRIKGKSLQR